MKCSKCNRSFESARKLREHQRRCQVQVTQQPLVPAPTPTPVVTTPVVVPTPTPTPVVTTPVVVPNTTTPIVSTGTTHAIFANAPSLADGWTTVFDWGCDFVPPASGGTDGWQSFSRALDGGKAGTGASRDNLSIVTDATQPNGSVNSNALRFNYPAGTVRGYAPATLNWVGGGWGANGGEAHFGWTMRVPSTWTDTGNLGLTGAGTKNFFWGNTNSGAQNHTTLMLAETAGRTYAIAPQVPSGTHYTGATGFRDGAWHTFEMRIKLGTTNTNDATLQFWYDGVPMLIGNGAYGKPNQYIQTAMLTAAGQQAVFNKYYWEPTWASGATEQTLVTSQFFDVGHVFCRVR